MIASAIGSVERTHFSLFHIKETWKPESMAINYKLSGYSPVGSCRSGQIFECRPTLKSAHPQFFLFCGFRVLKAIVTVSKV